MILIPLIHLCTTLVEYSQSTVLYEKYKELTTPVVQGKLLIEEPIHTIYMNNVSYAYGFHEPNGVNLRSWLFFIAFFPTISICL